MPTPILEITNGVPGDAVQLFDPASICIAVDGAASPELPLDGSPMITEQWTFTIKGKDQNAFAYQVQRLKRLLNQVNEFGTSSMWTRPIYLRQKGDCEENDRFAMLREAQSLEFPSVFDRAMRKDAVATEVTMKLVREHPWRSKPPGQLGSDDVAVLGRPAITLAPSNGPASPLLAWVANFRDNADVDFVYWRDDSLAAWSGNMKGAADGTALFPAAPAANDYHLIGGTDVPFKHVCYGIKLGGVYTWDTKLQYWSGAAYTDMVLGTHYTINQIEGGKALTDDDFFKSNDSGYFAINLFPDTMTGWTKRVDGAGPDNAYWIRLLIVSVASTTVVPQKNGDAIYAQRTPYVEIPATALPGDTFPFNAIRMWAPSGGSEVAGKPNISRVLIGAKSDSDDALVDLDDFEPMINCGNADNPVAWTVTYDTDTSAVADVGYPGGFKARTTFATDGTLLVRLEAVGDGVLPAYRGDYRVLVGFQQVGGAAGDVSITARVFVGEDAASDPHTDILEYESLSADRGLEVADLGLVQLPRARSYANDPMQAIDVAVHLMAERVGGSAAVVDWAWIYLFPVQEGSVGLDDPVTDSTRGSSALRGGSYLELDSGCIANRTAKVQQDAGGDASISEEWARFAKPIEFRNLGKRHRLYFLILHFSSDGWGVEPLVASMGEGMAVEIFMHYRYLFLRGEGG